MKQGIVFDIQRFSLHDGPGIRTTVFLKGCPLRCCWCHNPESWLMEPQIRMVHGQQRLCGAAMTADTVLEEVLSDVAYYRNSGGGLTVSGGEPMLQPSFTEALLAAAKAQGIHTCLETSGYCDAEQLKRIIPVADLILFDIKLTDPDAHRRFTGADNRRILHNLELLCSSGAEVILRCPIIPGINDTDAHIQGVAQLIGRHPTIRQVELIPYHDMGRGKWRELGMDYSLSHLKTVSDREKKELLERFQRVLCCRVTI